jgi:hypothetical protein
MLTHPLDDSIRTFYRGFGFETLPGDPGGGMAVRMADVRVSGF